jgi:hypothetical protein
LERSSDPRIGLIDNEILALGIRQILAYSYKSLPRKPNYQLADSALKTHSRDVVVAVISQPRLSPTSQLLVSYRGNHRHIMSARGTKSLKQTNVKTTGN